MSDDAERRFNELRTLFGSEDDADQLTLDEFAELSDKRAETLADRIVSAKIAGELLRIRDKVRQASRASQPSAQCFQYSCNIFRGGTRRKFRANLFRLAEIYSGYTRENTTTDGITKDGKHIFISLIFKAESDLNRFQSEVIELISVVSGQKRPLIDADDSLHPHELILSNQRTQPISISNTVQLQRVFKHLYQYDGTGNDPDNSAECDGYNDVASLPSAFGEYANIADPEVCVQMIEDPRSSYWDNVSPEAVHIKDKAKCAKNDKNDPNNFIYMSRFLHCYFDGLNAKPSKFPAMKIQYVRHDEEMVSCPALGSDPNPLGLPQRQRVIVRIIFWSVSVRRYAMVFIREGGVDIDATTYEIDLYFKDAIKAMTYLQWKEAQTEKAWVARRQGVVLTEGTGHFDQDEEDRD